MLVLQDQQWLSVWEKCSFAHRQVDEQPTKRSKKNDDKSAVAMLKKGDWQEREPVTDECHDRPGKPGKKSDQKLGQNSSKRQSFDARQLGCVFQDMTPPKSILRKCTDMPKPIQRDDQFDGILAPEKWWRDDGTSHELWWRDTVQPKTAGHASEGVSNTQNDVGHDLISCAQERTAQLRPLPRRGSQLHQILQHRISSQRQRQHRQVESTRT